MDAPSPTMPPTNVSRASAAIRTNRRNADEAEFYTSSRSIHMKIFAAVPLTMFLGGIVAWIGLASALQIATLGGLALIGYRFWHGQQISLKAVAFFLIGIVGVYIAAGILGNRMLTSVILAVVTLFVFERWGHKPLDFFREYLFADSVFTNEQRRQLPAQSFQHSRLTLLLFLSVIVFVPWLHSTTFAILLLCLLCVAILFLRVSQNGNPSETLRMTTRTARFMLSEYLTYPDATSPARSWMAPQRCEARRNTFTYLWLSLAVLLMISLSYCVPWELFAAYFQRGFQWSVPPSAMAGHTWLLAPLSMSMSASSEYRWALGIGAVLSFVLPYLMLFTLYLPSLQGMFQTMMYVEELKRHDPRTEYERRVDRTLDSEVIEN